MGLNTSQQEAERHPGIWYILIAHLPYVILRWTKHCLCPQEIQSYAVRTAQITCHENLEKGKFLARGNQGRLPGGGGVVWLEQLWKRATCPSFTLHPSANAQLQVV